MQRLLDGSYVVLGSDVAVVYAGRGYNAQLGRWVTVSGINMTGTQILSKCHLLDADFVIQSSTGALKEGILVCAFVLNDPSHPELSTPWFQGVQSKGHFVHWMGRREFGAGFFWRIMQGALVAGDTVTMGVGYE